MLELERENDEKIMTAIEKVRCGEIDKIELASIIAETVGLYSPSTRAALDLITTNHIKGVTNNHVY